jgi:hypothetical protein
MLTLVAMGSNSEYAIGMRFSSPLLERIRQHSLLTEESRNTWLVEAAHRQLQRGSPLLSKTTARELMFDKQPIILRVDSLTLELIDEACDEAEVNRTVWMTDAALSRMTEQPVSKLRRK